MRYLYEKYFRNSVIDNDSNVDNNVLNILCVFPETETYYTLNFLTLSTVKKMRRLLH